MATATLIPPEFVTRSLDATWNYARWLHLPDDGNRYEVINGVLYMTTAPSFFHQWIISRITRQLQAQLEDTQIGIVAFAPIGLLMPGCDLVQPDIVVVRADARDMIYDRRIHGVPALIVEVLSPNNAEKDTEIKRAAYAHAEVPEYWIVRPSERDVLVLTQPDPSLGTYLHTMVVPPNGELVSPTLPFRAVVTETPEAKKSRAHECSATKQRMPSRCSGNSFVLAVLIAGSFDDSR